MAMAVFSMTTGGVKASAGYFKPAPNTQEQTSEAQSEARTSNRESDTTQRQSSTTTEETGTSQRQSSTTQEESNTTRGNNSLLEKEETTSVGSSYLTKQQQSIMDNLGTDYSKVNWDMQYSPKGMDGIIVSVADYMDGRYPYLLVAITNIYDKDVTFSASGYVEGLRGQEVAEVSFYEDAIRPGSTIAKAIYCDNTPSGEIFWEEMDLPKVYSESVSWGGDWHLTTDVDGYYKVDYNIDSNSYMMPGYVTALLLNRNGDIVDAAYDYTADKGYYVSGTIEFFEKGYDEKVVDVAIFSNPLKTK